MIGVALVVGVGDNVPNGFAALHRALVERQGDGSLVEIDLAGLQVLILADEFALHLRRLRTEIGRGHIGPDCRRRRLDFRGFEILRERRSRRGAKDGNSQCRSLGTTCLGPPVTRGDQLEPDWVSSLGLLLVFASLAAAEQAISVIRSFIHSKTSSRTFLRSTPIDNLCEQLPQLTAAFPHSRDALKLFLRLRGDERGVN